VQLHGGPSPTLERGLAERGAEVRTIALYRWALPRDRRPLLALVDRLEAGEVDATLFTSQIQVAHLFAVAAEHGHAERLLAALNTRTLVASVGPVCSRALAERGVRVGLQPQHPKMGALVAELAAWFAAPRPC
jgi:uroporphyrinogen-III synthase